MSRFEEMELDSSILRGVVKMGFDKPFPIQERAIGPLLKGRDVIGQAKTGSGKTAAFSLPMLQSIDANARHVQALVLAPTRELAVQITEEMKKLGAYTGIKMVTIYGGQSINVQREALRHGVHVVVGTPGRVIDHIRRGWLDLRSAKFVVLDEADTMLDMGFIEDVEFILGCTPEKKQMCLFSATMPYRITELAKKYMNEPEKILIDSDEPSVETLDQYFAVVGQQEKFGFLADLLQKEHPASAIIFCRTKYGAHRLAIELQKKGFDTVPLHGNLSQHQRDHHMNIFRNGHADILVATDVASRGIDIPQVACVVNFEIPMDPLLYFHRVGRTARAGRAGKAFSLVSQEEMGDFARILQMTKAPITPMRPEDKLHSFQALGARDGDWRRRRFKSGGSRRPNRHKWRRYR
ncbi:MAG: DEAD/DEAH box helicase [Nitrososphaerales archaeon]|nr:DEAD/DEAH box helicase [Nitrososphaerales archaeon]